MIKVKVSYSSEAEKEKMIAAFENTFKIKNISKEYNKEGQYRRIHIELQEK